MEKLCATSARAILEMIEPEATSKGGIILPENAKEKPKVGKVVSAGDATCLFEGDLVLVADYAGTTLEYEGKQYRIVHRKEVLAVVKG